MDFDPFAFWNSLISRADRNQEPMAQALDLAAKGISTLQAMSEFWQKMFSMERARSGGLDSWKRLPGMFPIPSGMFPLAWGMVPAHEYLSLVRKYEQMKEKVAADEETIEHLRLLMKAEGREKREEPQPLYLDLMERQFDAFFRFMRSMQLVPKK